MLDRERLLSRVADLDGYLCELESIKPVDFEAFSRIERGGTVRRVHREAPEGRAPRAIFRTC